MASWQAHNHIYRELFGEKFATGATGSPAAGAGARSGPVKETGYYEILGVPADATGMPWGLRMLDRRLVCSPRQVLLGVCLSMQGER